MRLVAQQRLERAEADDLVGDLLEHPDALGAGQGEAFLVDDLAEDLLDLAPDLDLVGQVELRVQVLDDPVLDPELDVPERLPDGRLAGQPRRRRRRCGGAAGRCRQVGAGRARRAGAPAALPGRALSIRFSRDIAYTPSRPEGRLVGLIGHVDQRHANNDFFCATFRGRRRWPARLALAPPTTALANRRMSWETCASRLLRKNGTPRLRA